MQDTNHISGIGPLMVPEEVASWPLAPGWYLVIALVLLPLVFLVLRFLRSWRRNEYRREALRQLEGIGKLDTGQVCSSQVAELNRLLKISAMHRYTRERVASLSGEPWLEFLGASCSGCDFTHAPGSLLKDSGFRGGGQLDITAEQWTGLLIEAKRWIRKHH